MREGKTIRIRPSRLSGTAKAPPSKSMAHRLLICAGFAEGESMVRGIGAVPSEDILATMDCLKALGASCRLEDGAVLVRGTDIFSAPEGVVLPCRECGSTLRFFIPPVLLGGKTATLTGSERLLGRPLSVYEEICREQGLWFLRGRESLGIRGPLGSGEYIVPGNISSQFVSGLLFALPLLAGDSTIRLLPPVESRPYIDMTMEAMKAFGVIAEWENEVTIRIPGGQKYRPAEVRVEGDWSNAAFLLAMGIKVTGLDSESRQGDRCCEGMFEELRRGFAEMDISDCPDLGPVLFAFAAAHGGGRFTGTRRLRDKESDRAAAMAEELEKFGAKVTVGENSVTVTAEEGIRAPRAMLLGHGDHRIVMALSVLCVRTGGSIQGAEAVAKSFPDFFERLREAGADIEEESESGGRV